MPNHAPFDAYPDAARKSLRLIQDDLPSEAAIILLQCLMSIAHPDYLVNLAMLSHLPIQYKAAVQELIGYGLIHGYRLDEQAQLLAFAEAKMDASLPDIHL